MGRKTKIKFSSRYATDEKITTDTGCVDDDNFDSVSYELPDTIHRMHRDILQYVEYNQLRMCEYMTKKKFETYINSIIQQQ